VDLYEFTNVSEVCTASIIRVMSEAAHRKSVQLKGRKSDKAELSQTSGKGQYQVRAREPIGEDWSVTAGW
jgi:hypothetical protein